MKNQYKLLNHLLILLLACTLLQSRAQNIRLTPTVQPTMGHNVQLGNLNISGTVGQPANATLKNGNIMLTQGFGQPGGSRYNDHYLKVIKISPFSPNDLSNVISYSKDDDVYTDPVTHASSVVCIDKFRGFKYPLYSCETSVLVENRFDERYNTDLSLLLPYVTLLAGQTLKDVVLRYYKNPSSPVAIYDRTFDVNDMSNYPFPIDLPTNNGYAAGDYAIRLFYTYEEGGVTYTSSTPQSCLCPITIIEHPAPEFTVSPFCYSENGTEVCFNTNYLLDGEPDEEILSTLYWHIQKDGLNIDPFTSCEAGCTNRVCYTIPPEAGEGEYTVLLASSNFNLWPGAAVPDIECLTTTPIYLIECQGDQITGSSDRYTFSSEEYPYLTDIMSAHPELISPASRIHIALSGNFEVAPSASSVSVLLENLDIAMGENARITVNPGQKLVIDNSDLHKCCLMWDGIVVKGKPDEAQTITSGMSNQGYLVLQNGAILQDAYEAIRLWDPDWTNGSMGTGGIVQAKNSNFLNNRRSAEFMRYHHWATPFPNLTESPNPSYFSNCNFKTNDNHNTEHPFHAFVTAWSVAPIRFLGCTFENNHTITSSITDERLGDGISTIDAGVLVEDIFEGYTETGYLFKRNTFKNLHNGIKVTTEGWISNVRAIHAKFENCLHGILNEGVNLCTFAGNDFEMGGNPADVSNSYANYDEGIILRGDMAGYIVEQNNFERTGFVNDYSIGVRADNTGPSENRIYKNTFEALTHGIVANRQNQFTDVNRLGTGLQFLCNSNHSNEFVDISSGDNQGNPQAGVRITQGGLAASAGNSFSHNNIIISASDFNNTTVALNYFQTDAISSSNDLCPFYRTPSVTLNFLNVLANTCPANFGFSSETEGPGACTGCTGLVASGTNFSNYKSAHQSYKNRYSVLIDGGNTSRRLLQIDTIANGARLKDSLMTYAPNLSTTTLLAVAGSSNAMNYIRRKTVIEANPEAITQQVLDEWDNYRATQEEDVPDINKSDTLTYRSYLLDTLNYYAVEKQRALYSVLYNIKDDTTGFNVSLYRQWLDSADGLWAKREIVDYYLQQGKMDTAAMLLEHYDTTAISNAQDSIQYKSYKDYTLAYIGWMNTDSSILRLDSAHLTQLISIANQNEHLKGTQLARNVLNFFYDSLYFTPPLLPVDSSAKRGEEQGSRTGNAGKQKEAASVIIKPIIKLYPNPAQNTLTIEYNGLPENSNLYVVTMLGEIVDTRVLMGTGKTEIATSAYQNGVYLARIEYEGSALVKSKFVILK